MKINLNKPSQAVSHLLLEDLDIVGKVKNTKQWKTDRDIRISVQFNGVEMNPETLEKVLYQWQDSNCKTIAEKYDPENFDKRVEDEVKQRMDKLLKDKVSDSIDLLNELHNKLEDTNNLIKWDWE